MNRHLEGADDAQKTPRGHHDFNSYIQNLRVSIFRTDRQTGGEINLEEPIRLPSPHRINFFICLEDTDFGKVLTLGASSDAFFVTSADKLAILAGPILTFLPVR